MSRTSPITRGALDGPHDTDLVPNINLRNAITKWKAQQDSKHAEHFPSSKPQPVEKVAMGAGIKNAVTKCAVSITVPSKLAGLVVGTNGLTIKGIMDRNKVKISQTPAGTSSDRTFVITGQASQHAADEIRRLVGREQISHKVPNECVSFIIGKGGINVNDINDRFNVKVEFLKADAGDLTSRTAQITGSTQLSCQQATEAIDRLVCVFKASSKAPKAAQLTLQVPDKQVFIIIGKGGTTIREIQERIGVKIEILDILPKGNPELNPSMRTVSITGPSEQLCAQAADEIHDLVIKAAQKGIVRSQHNVFSHNVSVKIPHQHAGLIIGKGGMTIKEIQIRNGVKMNIEPFADVDDPESRTVYISGPTQEACEKVSDEIRQILW